MYQRQNIRLKDYDYSQSGLYFVTICVQDFICLFGKIEQAKMILNDAGHMVEKWYLKTENKFPNIQCLDWVIMPNHFHCIWEITDNPIEFSSRYNQNQFLDVSGKLDVNEGDCVDVNVGGQVGVNAGGQVGINAGECLDMNAGGHTGPPLHVVVQWFKTMTTNEYIRKVKSSGWQRFNIRLWQRSYYEYIIRSEQAYKNIAEYINNNPAKWQWDKFHNL